MANVGQIDYLTDIGTFLKASEITALQSQLKKINNLTATCITPLNNEMNLGLSAEALNIGGRAPLNELAQELKNKMQKTVDSITDLSGIIKGEGNTHRQQEANKYYEKVMERYDKLRKDAIAAKDNYNNHRDYTVTITETEMDNDPDTDGSITREITRTEHRQYKECILENETGEGRISIQSIDPRSGYCRNVQMAVENAQKFYDYYYEKAKKLKDECDSLDTSKTTSTQDTTGGTTNGTNKTSATYGGHTYVKVESYNDIRAAVYSKQTFKIPKGSKFIYDYKGIGEQVIEAKDGDIYFTPTAHGYGILTEDGNIEPICKTNESQNIYYYLNSDTLMKAENNDSSIEKNNTRYIRPDGIANRIYTQQEAVEANSYNDIKTAVTEGKVFKIKKGTTFTYDAPYVGEDKFEAKDGDIYFAPTETGDYGQLDENGNITTVKTNSTTHFLDRDILLSGTNSDKKIKQNNTRYEDHYD